MSGSQVVGVLIALAVAVVIVVVMRGRRKRWGRPLTQRNVRTWTKADKRQRWR